MLRRSAELIAVIKRLSRAVQTGDTATARALIADQPETLVVGTEREWLKGHEAVEVIAAQLAAMPGDERTFHQVEAYEDGSTGWGAAESTTTFPNGVSVRGRTTFVSGSKQACGRWCSGIRRFRSWVPKRMAAISRRA